MQKLRVSLKRLRPKKPLSLALYGRENANAQGSEGEWISPVVRNVIEKGMIHYSVVRFGAVVVGWMVTTMDLEVGVLLLSATLSMGMSTLASGK